MSPDVRIAAARIEKEASAHRTPQALKSLGIVYLVMGDINRAVPVLEEAADQPSSDPRILSDLSAAYLVRAAHNNQPQDYAKALAATERAAKTDPRVAEALFNRALALEALSLREQAREAWQEDPEGRLEVRMGRRGPDSPEGNDGFVYFADDRRAARS